MVQQNVMSSAQKVSFFGLVSQCVKGKKRRPFYFDNLHPKNQQKINSRVSPHKPIYACIRTKIERVLVYSDKSKTYPLNHKIQRLITHTNFPFVINHINHILDPLITNRVTKQIFLSQLITTKSSDHILDHRSQS